MTFDSDNDNDEKKEETPARRRRRPARRRVPAQIQDEQMDASEDVTPELQEIPSTMPLLPLRDVVVFNSYDRAPVRGARTVRAGRGSRRDARTPYFPLLPKKTGRWTIPKRTISTRSAPWRSSCVCSRCPTGASEGRWCRGWRGRRLVDFVRERPVTWRPAWSCCRNRRPVARECAHRRR